LLLECILTASNACRPDDYEKAKGKYIINGETLKSMKQDAVVMHPLPRVDEVRSPPACSGTL
jgi:aspartate carbamoyltransferase catalytic subunit